LYATQNQGDSWFAISGKLTGDLLRSVAVAPSDPNVIYVATYDTLFFTTNSGNNWYYVPAGIPNAKISYITVDPSDAQRVYVTLSGYSAGNKVYVSPDNGVNWYNYSGSLPNVPVNCLVYEKGSNEALYVGTDVGVFYTDGTLADWVPYQTGLPNVVVTELEISYNNNKLWASTFGRGLWNSDLYSGPAGTEDEALNADIRVFPNPTSGQFTIQVPENMTYDIAIYDVQGKGVFERKQILTSKETFEVSHLTSGTYVLRLSIGNQTISRKLIISR